MVKTSYIAGIVCELDSWMSDVFAEVAGGTLVVVGGNLLKFSHGDLVVDGNDDDNWQSLVGGLLTKYFRYLRQKQRF